MTNLKVLHMDNFDEEEARTLIDDEGIKNLTLLKELRIIKAHNITNLNHMTNLKMLDIIGIPVQKCTVSKILIYFYINQMYFLSKKQENKQ